MGKGSEGSRYPHPAPSLATVLRLSITGLPHVQGPAFAKCTYNRMNYLALNITRMMGMNKRHSIRRQNVACGFLLLPAFLVEVLEDRGPPQRVTLKSQNGGRSRVQTSPMVPTQSPRHLGKTHTWSRIRAASWAVCSRGVSVRVYFDLVSFQSFRYLIWKPEARGKLIDVKEASCKQSSISDYLND